MPGLRGLSSIALGIHGLVCVALGLAWFFAVNHPDLGTWEGIARGQALLFPAPSPFPDWFPYFSFYPISDLFWWLSFALSGGWGLALALLGLQGVLLLGLAWNEFETNRTGAAVCFLPWFLPGILIPGPAPIGYLMLGILWVVGVPVSLGWGLGWLILWLLVGPFSWILALGLGLNRDWPFWLRMAALGLGGLGLLRDAWVLYRDFDEVFAGWSLSPISIGTGLWSFFLALTLLGILALPRLISPHREKAWEIVLGLARLAIAALVLTDSLGRWGVVGPFLGRADPWADHEPFADLARVDGEVLAKAPSVTHSRWVWVHGFLEPKLSGIRWLDHLYEVKDAPALVWIGNSSPRASAAHLVEALSSHDQLTVAYLCGSVAVLFPHREMAPVPGSPFLPPELSESDKTPLPGELSEPKLWKEFRGAKLGLGLDPAAEACLALAWFQARRPKLVSMENPESTRRLSPDGREILAYTRAKADEAMQRGQSLGFAMRGEWELTRYLLEQNEVDPLPFEKSFRLSQVAYFLGKSLEIQPEDTRTRNLHREILLTQRALDAAVDWEDGQLTRRRGLSFPRSVEEWRVLDLSNQLAFFHPPSAGFSLARLREGIRLGLKGQILQELSTADPILAGPEGAKLRVGLLFDLGHIAEGKELLTRLGELGMDRDLGLVEWPRAGGSGPAAFWRFPAKLWYLTLAEATLGGTGASPMAAERLIAELQRDLDQLRKRSKERLPEVAGAMILGGPPWSASGWIAAQQWKMEIDLSQLASLLETQIEFLRRIQSQSGQATAQPNQPKPVGKVDSALPNEKQ